jgi:glycosyltransferase involved in cell wall biosynthesis
MDNRVSEIWIHALGAKIGGGITYLDAVLPEMLAQLEGRGVRLVLLLPRALDRELPPWVEVRPLPLAARNWMTRILFDQFILPLWMKKERVSALYCSGSFSPIVKTAPTVALLRNAIYFDPLFLKRETMFKRLRLKLEGRLITMGARNCKTIHYPSQSMRDLVEACAPHLSDRGAVNYYGVGKAFASVEREADAKSSAGGRTTFLYVMNYTLQKNLGFLLRALAAARREALPVQVIVTSRLDSGPKTCFSQDRALIEENDLIRSGYLSPVGPKYDDELIALYRSVDACIFPSICESFGHPLVEAMAMRKPLICSDLPFAREICGDYAVYVDPQRPEDLLRIWREWPRSIAESSRAGYKNVLSKFSWRAHVANLIESLTEGIEKAKGKRQKAKGKVASSLFSFFLFPFSFLLCAVSQVF